MLILLLDLIDDGEKNKFEIVYYMYKDLVRYIALNKLKNQQLADECAQNAWLSIARNFKKVGDPGETQTKNYIATITNTWANKVYNKELRETFIEYSDDILTDEADNDYFEHIKKTELAAVIDKLPEQQRMYLYLSYEFGYSSREIGKLYGVSDTSVRKQIQFAREKIRKELEN